MTQFFVQWGHLLTALVVFAGIWLYVWALDRKVKRLSQDIEEESDAAKS